MTCLKPILELIKVVLTYGTVIAIVVLAVFWMIVRDVDLPPLFMIILIISYGITLLTAALFQFIERLRLKNWLTFMLYVPASVAGTVGGVYLARLVISRLLPDATIISAFRDLVPFIIVGLIVSGIVIIFEYLSASRKERQEELDREKKRTAELELHGREATIQALRARLNPHFLFNTLNFITELIHQDPAKAEKAVLNLSEIYRRTLDLSEKEEAPVSREIELMRTYLENERMRFDERLDYRIEVDDACLGTPVPALIFQSFVENAITRGIAPSRDGGQVTVAVRPADGGILFTVEDTGAGCDLFEPGFGIRNVLRRMELLYGDRYRFHFSSAKGKGARVELFIPRAP